MDTGPALLLTAIGAILAFAVTIAIPGIDVNAAGVVLFFTGLLWIAVVVGIDADAARRARPRRRRERRPAPPTRPVERRPEPRYDPVLPPSGRPRQDPADAPTRRHRPADADRTASTRVDPPRG